MSQSWETVAEGSAASLAVILTVIHYLWRLFVNRLAVALDKLSREVSNTRYNTDILQNIETRLRHIERELERYDLERHPPNHPNWH